MFLQLVDVHVAGCIPLTCKQVAIGYLLVERNLAVAQKQNLSRILLALMASLICYWFQKLVPYS